MATKRSTKSSTADAEPKVEDVVSENTSETSEVSSDADISVVVTMKKKEFIDRIVERSGVKKGQAKSVVDATLKELGDLLQDGVELNVPPLGKLSVNRNKEVDNAFVMITKLRRAKGMIAGNASGEEGDEPTASDAGETTDAES